jgi:hypothetical protein
MQETVGKRASYRNLNAVAGWLLKLRLLAQGMGALVELCAEGGCTQPLSDGTLTVVSV